MNFDSFGHTVGLVQILKKCGYDSYICFRLSYDPAEKLENNAQEFVNPPYSLNFFPHGDENLAKKVLEIGNSSIFLSAFYQTEEGYILRLVNNFDQPVQTDVTICGTSQKITFQKYEVKTFLYCNGKLTEKDVWL